MIHYSKSGMQIACKVLLFSSVWWITKKTLTSWILFTFVFLYASVRLMITSCTQDITELYFSQEAKCMFKKTNKKKKQIQHQNANTKVTMALIPPFPVVFLQSVVMQQSGHCSSFLWSSVDGLNETAEVAADTLLLIPLAEGRLWPKSSRG